MQNDLHNPCIPYCVSLALNNSYVGVTTRLYIKHQTCITIERKYYKKHFAHLLKDENIL